MAGQRAEVARLAKELTGASVERRREIAEALYELCRENGCIVGAVSPLLQCLADADDKTGESALWGLRYCAPDSIEPLIDCLAHIEPRVRERAAHSLGNMGDDARAAADALRRLLADATPAVRSRAAWALGLVHDTSPRTVETLFRMTETNEARDRSAAFHALGNIGKALESPTLLQSRRSDILRAMQDPDTDTRRWALYAWEGLRSGREEALLVLGAILRNEESERVSEAAMALLKKLDPGPDLAALVPTIARFVDRGGSGARDACEILGALGASAGEARSTLLDAARRREDGIAIHAALALWAIEHEPDRVLPTLERLIDSHDVEVCDAISTIGPAASPLLQALLDAINKEEDWDFQWAAIGALGAIAEGNAAVVPALVHALGHASAIVRGSAARALARVGVGAVPELTRLVAERGEARAEWAADALGRIGPLAADAVPTLHQALQQGSAALKFWAAFALAKVAADVSVASILIETLGQSDRSDLRQAAVEALGELPPKTPGLARALERALDDDDDEVRAGAAAVRSRARSTVQ